jgi:CubicO group peptidase (beta-lactamase class C family)
MKHLKWISALFFAFILTTEVQASTLKQNVDSAIKKAIDEHRIVGTVILVEKNGKEVYRGIFGWNDRENHIPMTDNTAFRLASMTKPIVTVAALRLIDQGKLKLDDPVTKFIPDFKPKTPDGQTPTITIRNLLTHTAGLNYGFFEKNDGPYHKLNVSDGLNTTTISLEENVQRIAKAPLLFSPGTEWQYSVAIDVLGEVIERATKKSLQTVVNDLVLKPLTMKHTGFSIEKNQPLAVPYADHQPEPIRMNEKEYIFPFGQSEVVFSPARIFDATAFPSGGAGMVGTADDYMKFLESIRIGKVPLKKSTLQQMTSNQIGDLKTFMGPAWGWTLAFAILKNSKEGNTPQAKGTYSWGGIYGHTFWVDPKNKLTVVILTNTAVEGTAGKFPHEIIEAVYKK